MARFSSIPTYRRRSLWWWLSLAAVLAGTGLRVWQWSLGSSFFIDELALVHNVATRSAWQLISQPLADSQVAPPLFLLAEKACLVLLGSSEQALRLPALLASVAALGLLWRVAARLLWAPLVPGVLLALAAGYTFIYYGIQAKPYASDVAASLLVLELVLGVLAAPAPARRALLAGVGMLLPFYSHPSVVVLAGAGAALLLPVPGPAGRRAPGALGVVAAWAAGCAGSLLLARHLLLPATSAYLQFYWRTSMLPTSSQLPQMLYTALAQRLRYGLYWPHPELIWLLVALGGLVALGQRRPRVALALALPWLAAMLAALLRQFPFAERMLDYLLPSLLLAVFGGLQQLAGWIRSRGKALALAVPLASWGISLSALPDGVLPPYRVLEAKPLLAWLAASRRPGDLVYATYGAGQSLRWYGPQYQLPPGSYTLGRCYPHAPGGARRLLRELDALRGHRVWVLELHYNYFERGLLEAYLDSLGTPGPRREAPSRMPDGYPVAHSAAQLFDLTHAPRAGYPSAASFPVPTQPVSAPEARCWDCYPPVVLE